MPKNDMGVIVPERLLAEAARTARWIGEAAQGVNFTTSARTRSAVPCFAIAQEHHEGILLLIQARNYTSAFALERVAFDAYVRGVWLSLCATDDEITDFLVSEKIKKTYRLIEEIEKSVNYVVGLLSGYQDRRWKALCDFTHTGYRQIQRWNTETAIEPNYRVEEIVEVLAHSEIISLMALISFAQLVDNTELARKGLEKINTMRTISERYDEITVSAIDGQQPGESIS